MVELLERVPATPGQVALVVVAVFAARAFFGGIVRLAFGMVSLAVAAWLGYSVFSNGREWLVPVLGPEPGSEQVLYAAWAAGAATYFTLEKVATGSGSELVRTDPATGKTEVVVPAAAFVPGGAKKHLRMPPHWQRQ